MDREIGEAAKTLEGYHRLVSIKGIGPHAAALFRSSVGNVEDFECADKLARMSLTIHPLQSIEQVQKL